MGKHYNHEIHNLEDLKKKQIELRFDQERLEETFKRDLKTYIHQHSPGYMVKKITRKPTEKVTSVFNKVKSWFGKKKQR